MEKKTQVGVTIPEDELNEMREVTRVDANGPAVLALARIGLDYQKRLTHEGVGKREVRAR